MTTSKILLNSIEVFLIKRSFRVGVDSPLPERAFRRHAHRTYRDQGPTGRIISDAIQKMVAGKNPKVKKKPAKANQSQPLIGSRAFATDGEKVRTRRPLTIQIPHKNMEVSHRGLVMIVRLSQFVVMLITKKFLFNAFGRCYIC